MNLAVIQNHPGGITYCELQAFARTHAEKRRRIAVEAEHCVNWLRSQGLEVLAISDGPRITIRRSPLCDQFEGAVNGYSRGPKGEEWYKEVNRLDCIVRWEDFGNRYAQDKREARVSR